MRSQTGSPQIKIWVKSSDQPYCELYQLCGFVRLLKPSVAVFLVNFVLASLSLRGFWCLSVSVLASSAVAISACILACMLFPAKVIRGRKR